MHKGHGILIALARIVPDIDWKDAGLTDADLNMIGVDYLLQTEGENSIADALSDMMTPVSEQKEADKPPNSWNVPKR